MRLDPGAWLFRAREFFFCPKSKVQGLKFWQRHAFAVFTLDFELWTLDLFPLRCGQ